MYTCTCTFTVQCYGVLLLGHIPNVFVLVVVGDGHVLAVGQQVVLGEVAKVVMLHTERLVKYTLYVVLSGGRRGTTSHTLTHSL